MQFIPYILGILHGHVNQSIAVSTMFECQVKCSNSRPVCKSINYIENEDGSKICQINKETKKCALPGDTLLKENSFYIEILPAEDEVGLFASFFQFVANQKLRRIYKFQRIVNKIQWRIQDVW